MNKSIQLLILIFTINLSIKSTMSAQKLTNEIDSVSYSLGVNIGENLKTQFPDINLKNFLPLNPNPNFLQKSSFP